jgi:drug/metabolite transporter (DMT)-like permease
VPRLAIIAAAILFSTGGAAIKASTLSGWQVASFRSGVAAIVLALAFPAARRAISRRTLWVGLSYAVTMILFVLANKLTTAANAIFLQSTAPLYIAGLAPWLLGEKTRRRDILVMLFIAAGLALFFVDSDAAGPIASNPFVGKLLGVCAGLSWALTLLGLRWLEREVGNTDGDQAVAGQQQADRPGSGLAAVIVGNSIACVVALFWALPVTSATTLDWWLIGYLGGIQIGLAYVLLTFGFRKVSALTAALLILIEPSLSPLWAWLAHGEVPGMFALLGGVVIIGATALKSGLDSVASARDGSARDGSARDGSA